MTEKTTHIIPNGKKIAEFTIQSVLGEGGFGITYLAFDNDLKRQVAIKEYFPAEMTIRGSNHITVNAKSNSEENYQFGLSKFLEEAQTLAQFTHPNIVRVTRFIKVNNTAYLIMDYEQGEDLGDYLKRTNFKGNMPETELKSYIIPILKGLQAVHDKGLLHRDVKPGNIYLRKDAEPMLIDFGAARYALGEHSKSMSAIISMGYAPPEQYSTKGKQNQASDLYAWGATAYQLITGKPPIESPDRSNAHFEGEPDPLQALTKTHQGKYSQELLTTIDNCLQLPNKARPQTANQVIAMLKGEKAPINKTEKVKPEERFKNTKPSHSETGTKYVKDHERFANTKETLSSSTPIGDPSRRKPKKSKLSKLLTVSLLTIALATAGYYGYNYYQTQQQKVEQLAEQSRIAQQNETTAWTQAQNLDTIQGYQLYLDNWQNGSHASQAQSKLNTLKEQARLAQLNAQEKQAEQTKQAQKLLVKLGYTVTVTGKLEARTQAAIRDFEKKHGILETGVADSILITSLQKAYNKKDQRAWNQAQNSISKLNQYAKDYPDGQYIAQVGNKIQQVKQAEKKAEQQRLAKIAAENKKLNTPGASYKDCPDCPTMVVIPVGKFKMGSNDGGHDEKPIHEVTIKQFAMSQTEVTFNQYDACYNAGSCSHKPKDQGWGRGNRPVINVSWNDTKEYIKWLNKKTGKHYRLPTEAEWEYAARAGSMTKYSWGNNISCSQARYKYNDDECRIQYSTAPVKSFVANKFGLYDMHGNVWEWVEDKYHKNYKEAPNNENPWISGSSPYRMMRGGSWFNVASGLRSANRARDTLTKRYFTYGFRLAQDK